MTKQGCKATDGSSTCSYPSCKCDVSLPRTMEQKAERAGETRTVLSGYFRCSCNQSAGCVWPSCRGRG